MTMMLRIVQLNLAIFICIINLQHVLMDADNRLSNETNSEYYTTTMDPELMEQYARNTALSFGIFGVVFGLLNLICYIASIYKAIKDRKAIQLRNSLRRKMKQTEQMEQKQKRFAKASEPDSVDSFPTVVSTVIRKGTFNMIQNPDENHPHYFSKSPTLKRQSKVLKKSDPDDNPSETTNHLPSTDSN